MQHNATLLSGRKQQGTLVHACLFVPRETLLEPAAYGFDLLCRGIRRMGKDDHEALRHGAGLYDALCTGLAAETKASHSDTHVSPGG